MTTAGMYGLLADTTAFLHLGYVLFVVVGQGFILAGAGLGWGWIRNPVFRLLHLLAIAYVAGLAILARPCPLTVLEYHLRDLASQHVDTGISFMGRIFRTLLYYEFPPQIFSVLHIGFAALVLLTLLLIPPRGFRRSR